VTPNGKIDYDALPAAPVVDDGDEAPVAPTDVIEEALCRLWAAVLGAEVVGIRDDFFARGGHSLLATQLVSRIRGAFGFELPLRTLFEHPTVADVAAVLRRDAGSPPQVEGAAEALLQVLLLSDEDVEAMLERTDAAGGAPS
jgi:acyl carrier protein